MRGTALARRRACRRIRTRSTLGRGVAQQFDGVQDARPDSRLAEPSGFVVCSNGCPGRNAAVMAARFSLRCAMVPHSASSSGARTQQRAPRDRTPPRWPPRRRHLRSGRPRAAHVWCSWPPAGAHGVHREVHVGVGNHLEFALNHRNSMCWPSLVAPLASAEHTANAASTPACGRKRSYRLHRRAIGEPVSDQPLIASSRAVRDSSRNGRKGRTPALSQHEARIHGSQGFVIEPELPITRGANSGPPHPISRPTPGRLPCLPGSRHPTRSYACRG